jgi:hypothetical protein
VTLFSVFVVAETLELALDQRPTAFMMRQRKRKKATGWLAEWMELKKPTAANVVSQSIRA